MQEHAVCEFIALVALDARQEGAGGAGEVVAFLGRGEELLRRRVGVVDCVCADGGRGEVVFLEGVREGGLFGLEFGLRGLVEGGGEGGFVEGAHFGVELLGLLGLNLRRGLVHGGLVHGLLAHAEGGCGEGGEALEGGVVGVLLPLLLHPGLAVIHLRELLVPSPRVLRLWEALLLHSWRRNGQALEIICP